LPAKLSKLVGIVDGQKRCGRCRIWKSVDEFHKASTRGNHGLQCYCKGCANTARNEHGRSNRARNPSRALWLNAKDRARINNHVFTITEADVVIPEFCPVFGCKLNPVGRNQGLRDQAPSIDRIDNDQGYTPNNIIVVSWRANRIKSDASPAELRAIADFYEEVAA
jgi:hypothetical protein